MSYVAHFCFPVKRLENSRVVLEPFDFWKHAESFLQGCKDHPELFQYLPYGPFASIAEFEAFYRVRSGPGETLFAVLAKLSPSDERGSLAGVIGLLNASPNNGSVEIGFVNPLRKIGAPLISTSVFGLIENWQITILPPFQRTHVASSAVGLLIAYSLDLPPDGLGLRRCQWQAHACNEPSRRLAQRMGFTFEGVQRFQRVIPLHKSGNGFDVSQLPEATGVKLGNARDTAIFAHYCDEWEEKRNLVLKMMEPR